MEIVFTRQSARKMKRKRPKPKKVKKVPVPGVDDIADQKQGGDDQAGDGEEEQAGDGEEEVGKGDDAVGEEEQKAGEEEEKEEEDEKDEEDNVEDQDGEEGPKTEDFLPESFVFFEKKNQDIKLYNDQIESRKEELLNYCDNSKIEILPIDLTYFSYTSDVEGLENLRLYIERVG